MTTKWAHLPNAAHIDRVLVSMEANREQWKKSWVLARGKMLARVAARGMVLRVPVRGAAWDAAWDAERDAILALVAYDECAYMLDSDPGELAILAAFGDPRAVLILPACEILHSIKELV